MADEPKPRKFAYGAMSPSELAWQMGKTAGSILFVQDIEATLDTCSDPKERDVLLNVRGLIMAGKLVITSELSANDLFVIHPTH